MKQLALDIGLAPGPSLDRFFIGPNEEAIAHLRLSVGSGHNYVRSPVPTYLWGESGCGKTHLLRATYEALREQGQSVGWLDSSVSDPAAFSERWVTVIMDEVHLYKKHHQVVAQLKTDEYSDVFD